MRMRQFLVTATVVVITVTHVHAAPVRHCTSATDVNDGQVRIEVCLVTTDHVSAVNGDLIASVENLQADTKLVNVACTVRFSDPMAFKPLELQTRFSVILSGGKRESDIIEAQMNYGRQHSWLQFSDNKCSYTIEREAARSEPNHSLDLYRGIKALNLPSRDYRERIR